MTDESREIRVDFSKELVSGVYANNMAVAHTREEFIMDFLMIVPPTGSVTARVIVSPGHMKRIIKALQENIAKYEQEFGSVTETFEMTEKVTIQ